MRLRIWSSVNCPALPGSEWRVPSSTGGVVGRDTAGNDLFQGDDDFTIVDFHAGAGSEDRIDLRAVAGLDDFADVQAAARSITGGVVLDFGDDEITLVGVNAAQLVADDFLI